MLKQGLLYFTSVFLLGKNPSWYNKNYRSNCTITKFKLYSDKGVWKESWNLDPAYSSNFSTTRLYLLILSFAWEGFLLKMELCFERKIQAQEITTEEKCVIGTVHEKKKTEQFRRCIFAIYVTNLNTSALIWHSERFKIMSSSNFIFTEKCSQLKENRKTISTTDSRTHSGYL